MRFHLMYVLYVYILISFFFEIYGLWIIFLKKVVLLGVDCGLQFVYPGLTAVVQGGFRICFFFPCLLKKSSSKVNLSLCRHLDVTSVLLFSKMVDFGSVSGPSRPNRILVFSNKQRSQDFIPALYGLVVWRIFHLISGWRPFSLSSHTLAERVVLPL